MSLASIRRSSRVIAAVLLASLLQLPHLSVDDEACSPASAERHDESKHVFTSVSPAAHQDHCAICHWTRGMKPVFSAGRPVSPVLKAGRDLAPTLADVLRAPATDRLPPRAPPVL